MADEKPGAGAGDLVQADGMVAVVGPDGWRGLIPVGELAKHPDYRPETREEHEERKLQKQYGEGLGNELQAGAEGVARGLTLGLSDEVADLAGAGRGVQQRKIRSPLAAGGGEFVGVVAPALVTGGGSLAAKGAAAVGKATVKGALKQAGAAAIRGGAEGVAYGAASGLTEAVSEHALEGTPLNGEHVLSTIGSHALYGGLTGGVVGGGASLVGSALRGTAQAAKSMASRVASKSEGVAGTFDDLAKLDRPGLRAAREAELATIAEAKSAAKATIADDLAALRAESKKSTWWLHSPDAEAKAVSWKADKRIRSLLDNPKDMIDQVRSVRSALRQQETGLASFISRADEVRLSAIQAHGVEGAATSARVKALADAERVLARNKAMQAKLDDIIKPPASPRLTAIEDAADNLLAGGTKKGLPQQLLQGAVFSGVTGLASPVVGPLLGSLLGAKVAGAVGEAALGKLGGKLSGAAAMGAKAVQGAVTLFTSPAGKSIAGELIANIPGHPGQWAKTPGATKVLTSVSYASPEAVKSRPQRPQAPTKNPLVSAYRDRERELSSQVQPGPDGRPVMSLPARTALHERLSGVAAVNPMLADKMETVAARRIEYLASKLPKRPDMGLPLGPDRWQPSRFAMASFARTAAAVEDPVGVLHRLSDGTLSPEDAEALRTVYPEMYADAQRQVMERLPELRETMPYARRLTLSILMGVPVDPAMAPNVLAVLQGNFKGEPGTQGGAQPPKPSQPRGTPKSLDKPTSSQERAGG